MRYASFGNEAVQMLTRHVSDRHGFFRQNRVAFHDVSGRGYQPLAERLILVDAFKPGNTYWLMPQIVQWRRFDTSRAALMRAALEQVLAAEISPALYEIVNKTLQEVAHD